MRLRDRFRKDLDGIHSDLRVLGDLVVEAIGKAVDALVAHDTVAAQQVIDNDRLIDERQMAIEEQALVVMATQQPIAGDLRRLVAAIEIASELERIADYAKGVAKITIRNKHINQATSLLDLPLMAQGAISMLQDVLEAFVKGDASVGQRLIDADDRVDEYRRRIRTDLTKAMQENPEIVPAAIDLLFMAHNLERIADRTTNIAERIVFMISGQLIELNP